MKERILLILKEAALRGRVPSELALTPNGARQALFHIIRNFSDFNVMTIDAFMNNILKAFAIEAARFPDYELRFDPDEIYAFTLDRLMEKEEARIPFLRFLDYLLSVEQKWGFNPEGMIRSALFRMRKQGRRPEKITCDPDFHFREKEAWDELRAEAAAFYTDLMKIQAADGCFNRRSVRPDDHLRKLDAKQFPPWIVDGRELGSLLKKNASCPGLPSLTKRLKGLREGISQYFIHLEIQKFLRVLEVFRLTYEEEARIYRERNQFDGSRLPDKVQDLLAGEAGFSVPAAFCRLGERYVHHLVDEFQDTSRSQWGGMIPLIENSLSEGGSFFYVGDMKQAIYGWRGGDYALMEEAFALMPSLWEKNCISEKLETNWRSCKNLVDFFNHLFDSQAFDPALSSLISDPAHLEELKAVYKHSRQNPRRDVKGGFIHARFFGDTKDLPDPNQPVREAFFKALVQVRGLYPDREILVLGRKNDEIETIAGWLFEHPQSPAFVTEQSLKLFTLPPIKSILNLLSCLALPGRDVFLHAAIQDGLLGNLAPQEVSKILAGFSGASAFSEYLQTTFPDLDAAFLAPLRKEAARLSPYELTRELIIRLGIPQKFPLSHPLLDRLLEQILIQEQKGIDDLSKMLKVFYEKTDEIHLVLPETPEAIRLMTIHKAKGLEADVVILPFLNWPVLPRRFPEIFEVTSGQYAFLTNDLCTYHAPARRRKDEIRKKQFIESFNLLYVALTRAREALFLIIPPGKRGMDIGSIFRRLSEYHGYLSPGADTFSIGALQRCDRARVKTGEKRQTQDLRHAAAHLDAGAREIRSCLRFEGKRQEEHWLDERARRMGNIAHGALATLGVLPASTVPEQAAVHALTQVVSRMGFSPKRGEMTALQRVLAAALRNLNEYFTQVDEAWTEKELVSKEGKIIRIDRLVRRGKTFTVLEFKTGRREEDHVGQVRHYLRVLSSLGIGDRLRGILYYLDTGETVHV